MKTKTLFALLMLVPAWASAATVTLDALNSGSYGSNGTFVLSNNYGVGWSGTRAVPNNLETRNYFVFDLSGLTGTITSATLRLQVGSPAYFSPSPTEDFSIFDVSTPISTLIANSGGLAAFADLGTGTSFGTTTVPSSISGFITVDFNAQGLAFLQANSGQVALGGAMTTLAKGTDLEALFNSTGSSSTRQLVVTTSDAAPVPEPGTFALLMLGLAGLCAGWRARIPVETAPPVRSRVRA